MSNSATITVHSPIISPVSDSSAPLTPAMTACLWQIADALDQLGVPAIVKNAVWLELPAKRLRGPGSQDNNRWLRECLRRLTGQQIAGEYRGATWGAVLLAEWHLEKGSDTVRLLIPPAAVQALRAPETFAKIETAAIYQLNGKAARLYAALADKKRLNQPNWVFTLDQLRRIFGVEGRYPAWRDIQRRLLHPSIEAINKFGTVNVTMTTVKEGRRMTGVRFAWRWKNMDEARRAAEEAEKANPYAEEPAVATAPPLIPEYREDREQNEAKWWNELPPPERAEWRDHAAARLEAIRVRVAEGQLELARKAAAEKDAGPAQRRALADIEARASEPPPPPDDGEIRRFAWEMAHPDQPRYLDLDPRPPELTAGQGAS